MQFASTTRPERRAAVRYHVPARAQLFWAEARAVSVLIADISALGCSVVGEQVPAVGARVFVSLDMTGLPNVRLPATTIRHVPHEGKPCAAVRFDLPPSSARGIDKLLSHRSFETNSGCVIIVDSDAFSRERVAQAVRARGLHVIAVSDPVDAVCNARDLPIDAVLARSDKQGFAALAALAHDAPGALRIVYGRRDALEHALSLGVAQAVADDPTSAKCLGRLLGDRTRKILPHT